MSDGKEARRSDMLWAIVNTYIKGMDIRAVSFPVHHHRTVGNSYTLNVEKTIAEIRGAGLYAGLLKCLLGTLDRVSVENVFSEMNEFIRQRLSLYETNFIAARNLITQIKRRFPELYRSQSAIFSELEHWVQIEMLEEIKSGAWTTKSLDVKHFLESTGFN
jgi:hypothetical protein